MVAIPEQTDERSFKPAPMRVLKSPYMPALMVFVVVILSIVFADGQSRRLSEENLRAQVTEQLSLIRARLDGNISGNIQLVQGLVVTLETEPGMAPERFHDLAQRLFHSKSQIRDIAAAPDFVVTMVYPMQGNEKVLGLDYRDSEAQRDVAFLVRDTGELSITGPVNLVQGGQGLIVRYPVKVSDAAGGQKFWGILSAVIDLNKLFLDSGLLDPNLSIDVSVADDDAAGHYKDPFLGSKTTVLDRPVTATIQLGNDNWLITAVPKGGWEKSADGIWLFRLMAVCVGLMAIAPMIWAGRLMEERRQYILTLQQRKEQLKALSHRLEVALETSKIGIWEFDASGGELIWDERMRDLYDIAPARRLCEYSDWANALHPDDVERAEREFQDALVNNGKYESEFRLLLPSGEIRHIRSIGNMFRDASGGVKVVGVNWNVTEDVKLQNELREAKRQTERQNAQLEQARQLMEYNSLHDSLTKLPNRRYLDQMLTEKGRQSAARPPMTILHIDLDRFKDINDTLGHAAGDEILRHAASVLTAVIPGNDFVARIGGDEFVIVSEAADQGTYYADLARRIIDAMGAPIVYQGHECRAGVSIGVASQSDGEKPDQLLINADIALYEAKRRGRNCYEFFTDTLRLFVVGTKQTADEVLRGLERNEFTAFFQPQFDAHSLEIAGVEALVRWDHPVRGIVTPDAFLKVAEGLNVVAAIDRIVLEQALQSSRRWAKNGFNIPKISVNISAQRLHDHDLFNQLAALNIRPGSLCFELLESISFDEHDETLLANIQKIKAFGIDIEIDDFGTGYASIINLLKLTPRRLKIDRQLISPILEHATERKLVSSIIDIGKACGIEIIAEGVETMAHAALLRDLGCQTLQGYALARPMSGGDFLQFARNRQWMRGQPEFVRAAFRQTA